MAFRYADSRRRLLGSLSAKGRVRVRSACGPSAGLWLRAVPDSDAACFRTRSFAARFSGVSVFRKPRRVLPVVSVRSLTPLLRLALPPSDPLANMRWFARVAEVLSVCTGFFEIPSLRFVGKQVWKQPRKWYSLAGAPAGQPGRATLQRLTPPHGLTRFFGGLRCGGRRCKG